MITEQGARVAAGDVVEIEGRRVGDTPRTGEILEVLGTPDRPHYRVRWSDGHESVFFPAGGTTIRRTTAAVTDELVRILREADVEFELLPHRRTQTATSEARALGVLPQETAKTVLARAGGGYVRAVVPASRRLDAMKLGGVVGATEVSLLSEDELARDYPEFELGATPPFGGREGDRVVVDGELAECEYVVLEAGVHDRSLRLRADDLIEVAEAEVAAIATA
jgi:Ala-tRNA(Pro) deacylase